MDYLFIYLLQMFDSISELNFLCWLLVVLAFIVLLVLGFLTGFQYEEYKSNGYADISERTAQATTKVMKKFLTVTLTLALLLSFIPTKQTLLVMGGLFLGKKAVNTVITDEKIKKIDTIINLELNKRIKELEDN